MASKIKVDQIQTADGSGTIALQNQLSGMTTASLPALGSAQMPTGSVLQVIQASYSTETSSTSTNFVSTGLSATITPLSTSSKIYIIANQSMRIVYASSDVGVGFAIKRGSTTVQSTPTSYVFYSYNGSGGYSEIRAYQPVQYLDSPNTTSATTYTINFNVYGSGTAYANDSNNPSLITLMEIAG